MEEPPVFPKKTNYIDKMKWGFNHIAGAAGRFGDFQDRDLGHSGPWGNVGWLWSSFPTHSQVFFFSLSINGFVHRRKQPDDPDRHNGDFDLGHFIHHRWFVIGMAAMASGIHQAWALICLRGSRTYPPIPHLEVMVFHATHGLKVVIARHLVTGQGLPGTWSLLTQ